MYKRIRDLREDKDLNQTQVAKMLGMSQTGYSKYETGENDIPTNILIELAKFLKSKNETIISNQIGRSGTSIGANIREANHAQSKADFLNKMNIALKEADETDYWLNLLHDNGYLNDSNFESINHDCIRILKCLSAIVKSVKTKLGK